MAGSSALTYQYGKSQITSGGLTTATTAMNAFLVYGNLLLRERGDRYDVTARVDAGYTQNLLTTTGGSQDRTTAAYVELTDRQLGLTGRVGRQSLASQGVVGLFDGLYASYLVSPKLSIGAAAGFPAYTSYSAISAQQKFGTLMAEYGPYRQAWVFDAYFFDELSNGSTERRAVGIQTRYAQGGRSAVMLADYDIAFQQLNSITLIGNLKVGRAWVMGFDVDHRRSPLLLRSNALIGQASQTLSDLETLFTPSQIMQLAQDRTATSDTLVVSATRPLGEHWQFMSDIALLRLGGTPASGGVAETLSPGVDKNAAVQMAGTSLLQSSDMHIFGVRYDNSPSSQSVTLSWDARFVFPGALRFGPRFSVEQLTEAASGSKQMLFLPAVRGDWTGRKSIVELTGGYQIQQLQQQQLVGTVTQTSKQSQRNLYISAAYRLRF
jgi:hypothetical protein